jgi:hypothetical protein
MPGKPFAEQGIGFSVFGQHRFLFFIEALAIQEVSSVFVELIENFLFRIYKKELSCPKQQLSSMAG